MAIYIIRHGQTEMNKAHVLQGRTDSPLNDRGIDEAEKAEVLGNNLLEIRRKEIPALRRE